MGRLLERKGCLFFETSYFPKRGIWLHKRDYHQLKNLLRIEGIRDWIMESGVVLVSYGEAEPSPCRILTVRKVKMLVKKIFYKHRISFKGLKVLSFKTQVFLGATLEGYDSYHYNIGGMNHFAASTVAEILQELQKIEGVDINRATSAMFDILKHVKLTDYRVAKSVIVDMFKLPRPQRQVFYKAIVEENCSIYAVKTVVYWAAKGKLGVEELKDILSDSSLMRIAGEMWDYPDAFIEIYRDLNLIHQVARSEGVSLERLNTSLVRRLRSWEFSHSSTKTIPSPTFELDGYKLIQLKNDSPLHLLVGAEVGSCQKVGDAAQECCRHALESADGTTWVVLNKNNRMVAHSWVWRVGDDLVIDNIEAGIIEGNSDAMRTVGKLYKMAIDWITQSNPLGLKRVLVGIQYTEVEIPGAGSPIKNPHTPPVGYSDAAKVWAFDRKEPDA